MANKNVISVELIFDDKGRLKGIGTAAEKTSKSVKKLGTSVVKTKKEVGSYNKSLDHHQKMQKGVYQTGLSSAKGFSKQAQSISGGIVPAYAVLAANIFALTAAFNALKREAQIEDLTKGLQFMGNVAGRNLSTIAAGVREITGEAVSLEESMRTVAIGISAGFSGDQLRELTKVAKGASIALGRDLGDALSRLTRGVAKLEPEILDELGILVRLDTASRNYAAQMGLTIDAMTQFDRQQAFMNATLEQGIEKYGDITEAIEINPYAKLSASIMDLAKSFLSLLNNSLGLGKVVEFLSKNTWALAGVAGALGIQLTRSIAPGMFAMAKASAKAADQLVVNNRAMLDSVDITGKMPKVYGTAIGKIKEGTGTTKDFQAANTSLTRSLRAHEAQLVGNTKLYRAGSQALRDKTVAIDTIKVRQAQLIAIQNSENLALARHSRASAISLASRYHYIKAVKMLTLSIREEAIAQGIATKNLGLWGGVTKIARVSTFALVGAVKTLGAAFFAVLPWLGLIISVGTALYSFIRNKWFPEDLVKKRIDKAKESFENFAKISEQFTQSSATGGARLANSYIAYAGVLDDIKDTLVSISDLQDAAANKALLAAEVEKLSAAKKLADLQAERSSIMARLADTADADMIALYTRILRSNQQAINTAAEASMEANNKVLDAAIANAEAQVIVRKRAQKEILAAAIASITKQVAFEKAMGDEKGVFTKLAENNLAALKDLQTQLDKGLSPEELEIAFAIIQRGASNVRDSFKGIKDAIIAFAKEQNKLSQRSRGQYDPILEAAEAIEEKFKQIGAKDEFGKLLIPAADVSALLKELGTNIEELDFNETFGTGRTAIQALIKFNKKANDEVLRLTESTKILNKVAKRLTIAVKNAYGENAIAIDATNRAIEENLALKNIELDQLIKNSSLKEEDLKTSAKYLRLTADITKLTEQLITSEEKSVLVRESALRLAKLQRDVVAAEVTAKLKILKTEQLINNLTLGRGARLTEGQKYENQVAASALALSTAEAVYTLEILTAAVAYDKLEIELALSTLKGKELTKAENLLQNYRSQLDLQLRLNKAKVEGARAALTATAISGFGTADLLGGPSPAENVTSAMIIGKGVSKPFEDAKAAAEATKKVSQDLIIYLKAQGLETSEVYKLVEQDIINLSEVIAEANIRIGQSFLLTTSMAIQPFLESLRALGPEGEMVASIAEGSLTISSALLVITEDGAKAADKLAAVGSIIGSIMGMYKAKSDAVIAGIDREIEAEKKRDGKSVQSVAKLAALEKKKEKAAKKAFDVNKKLMMAQTVVNTAAAVVAALAQSGNPIVGFVMAGIMAALGAAQLAIIAGTSYEGGGAASTASMPSAVAIGARTNTVDLAAARSPSGELAYARGESGIGTGATSFVPGGFAGRAVGGNVGLTVGEQGPELFIPERPGTIVPADEAAAPVAPVSVSFSISAVDAEGIEELLEAKRSYIIGMIREAANAQGEFFLETID